MTDNDKLIFGQTEQSDIDNSLIDNSVTDSYLCEILKGEFEKLDIIDCIDLDDPYYINKILEYASSSSYSNMNCVFSENKTYKILLKGYSNVAISEYTMALYIPKHVNRIYIDRRFFIHLNDAVSSYKQNLSDILEESKKIPKDELTFSEKYKKIVLMEPFMPNKTTISFDTDEIFYYEALISNITFGSLYEQYLKIVTKNIYIDDIISNISETYSEYGDTAYWVNYTNDYMRMIYGNYNGSDYYNWILMPNNLGKFNTSKKDQRYIFDYVDMYRHERAMLDIERHNYPILCMFIDKNNYGQYFRTVSTLSNDMEKLIGKETNANIILMDMINVIEDMYQKYVICHTSNNVLDINFALKTLSSKKNITKCKK